MYFLIEETLLTIVTPHDGLTIVQRWSGRPISYVSKSLIRKFTEQLAKSRRKATKIPISPGTADTF
jgi:hypothetical protein